MLLYDSCFRQQQFVPRETVPGMAANNIKLQRTSKGDGEIRKKSHALTQGESQRLVLASIETASARLQNCKGV